MRSSEIAIEPIQIPRQPLEAAHTAFAEGVRHTGAADPGHAAAVFRKLVDSPGRDGVRAAAAVAPGDPVSGPRRTAGVAVDPAGRAPSPGDRVLANTPLGERQARAVRQATPAETVAARSSIDMGGLMDMLRTQAEIAQFRARVGLAAAGVQRSTQGIDTLLKSQ